MNQIYSDKILLVEDDLIYGSVLSTLIKPHFGLPITLTDGNEALNYLLNTEAIPCMILMDYRLPQLSGLEIIGRLKDTGKDYPIIFLTAEGGTAIAVDAMKKGAIDFLEKGRFNMKDLPLMIKKNISIFQDRIEKKRLQKELEITFADLKNTQVQLLRSEKMASLGTLLAGVAHEINNPINYINSSVIGLQNVFGDILNHLRSPNNTGSSTIDLEQSIERIEKMLTNIKTGISKTVQIVNSLSTFSRNSEGIMRPTNIHENIDSALTILYNQYKGKVEIIKNYGDIPLINCFPDKINQVLVNLLANAIQAIEKRGEIIITTHTIKDKVSISIEDTGSGIPESIQSKIFDPFFTTKDPGKGTGLGMSIAYDIIKQHTGEILVQSKVGEGTKFTIIIPINGE